jgi:uncharacterized protein YgbK (DUF1537 family)
LFCIGSDHPTTQRQLNYLKVHRNVAEYTFSERKTYSDEPLIVSSIARDAKGVAIRKLIASTSIDLSCIFLTGGDTAGLVCEAMDVGSIEVREQFAPGVPIGVIHGGPLSGITVVLKSGGFGETELLAHIAERYAVEERRTVGF